jgi:hypothetical protein
MSTSARIRLHLHGQRASDSSRISAAPPDGGREAVIPLAGFPLAGFPVIEASEGPVVRTHNHGGGGGASGRFS